jgi:HlyD family secretion protein
MTMATNATQLPALPNQQPPLADIIERVSRSKRRRRLSIALAAVALPLLLAGVWLLTRPKPVPLAARFRSAAVTQGDVVREVNATGHLEAITTVQVGAEVSGRIATVEVDYNDSVKAGQVLARFDRAALEATRAQSLATLAAARAAVEQAKTDRDRAARDEQRADKLFAAGVMDQSQHEAAVAAARLGQQRVVAAEAQLAAQQAASSLTKTNLDRTLILAPIDGVVITRNVDPGQTVASMLQTPVLFTVAADLRKMRVIAAVDEADTGEVAVGQEATFTVNAYPNRSFRGVVTEVRNSPQIVQDVVTYGTVVEVENADLALKPGMTASVHVITAQANHAARLPAGAFQFMPPGEKPGEQPGVWLLRQGQLKRVRATPGVSDGELTATASEEIRLGDQVLYELTAEGRAAYGISH